MTTSTSFIERLCGAVQACDGGDAESRKLIGRAIVDTIGVAAAGFAEPVARSLAGVYAGSAARAWSGETCESKEAAVFVDAVAAHALDFDDVYLDSATHPSTVILPAILRLDTSPDPRELVAAFGAGLIAARAVAQRVGLGHYHKGWHGTGTIGAFAAAAAAGRLLRLDEAQLRAAFALAAAQSAGLRLNFGSAAKPCQAGFAAVAGYRAARLAQAGLEGASDIFGPGGYVDLYGVGDGVAEPDDDAFAVRADEIAVKLYPCCYASHRLIGVALDARRMLGPIFRDPAASVSLSVPAGSLDVLRYDRPRTPMEAKFSGPYALACALLDGMPTLAHFTEEALARPDIAASIERIRIHEDQSQPSGGDIRLGTVTLTTRTGGTERCFSRHSIPGGPDDPPASEDIIAKTEGCLSIFRAGGQDLPVLAVVKQIDEARAWLGR
jgi:2-methylcitrate dehydratase PrpD